MIREIYLKDFRNYHEERITLEKGVSIVCGENAQGKTNLLEAIYFSMRGGSFRSAGNRDLIREGAETGVVMARFEEGGTEKTIARQIFGDGTTRTKVDGKEGRFSLESAVVFSQDDLAVIKGDPQRRREFIDGFAGEMEREFEEKNTQFKKALHQRNETLKRIRKREMERDALPAWEEIIAARGSFIAARRKEILEKLAALVDYRLQGDGGADFRIKYYGTFEDEQDYRARLVRNREKEIARGMTVTGPHRDEMVFFLSGRNLKTKGSQGQQRKAAILLKVACAEMLEEKEKRGCTLLLDDMPSELDSHNTGWLMEIFKGKEQVILTINPNRLTELDGADGYVHVKGGKVV